MCCFGVEVVGLRVCKVQDSGFPSKIWQVAGCADNLKPQNTTLSEP